MRRATGRQAGKRRRRWGSAAVVCLALAGAAAFTAAPAGQTPPSSQPTFRSGVDLVAVDVTVTDRRGVPVLDLTPEDFVVRVDGTPRDVVSARVLEFASPRRLARRPGAPAAFSTNRPQTAGRAVTIVVDAGSFAAMEPKAAIDAALRFVDELAPEDRLALASVPGFGQTIDFTTDHDAVRRALREAIGNAWDMGAHRQFQSRDLRVGKTEALAWDRGNRTVIDEVTLRECGTLDSPECFEQLALLATQLASEVRSSADRRLSAIERLLEGMAQLPGPKWMILISAGVAFEFDMVTPSRLAEAAARGQTTVHAVLIDTATIDPFGQIAPSSFRQDREFERAGLENIVGFARGVVHRVVANATPAFDRIASEISALWELGVVPRPDDLDGKGHRLDVEVKRPGVVVRARPQLVADPRVRARTTDTWLESALRTPAALSALPLKVATYSFRDGASQRVRVVLSVEVGFEQGTTREAWLAYEARSGGGRVAGRGTTRAVRTDPARPGVVHFVGALTLPQGTYTLRMAAVDQDGRLGNVDHPISAQFRPSGGLRVSDLLVGEARDQASADNVPAEATIRGSAFDAYFEVYGPGDAPLDGLQYRLDLVRPGEGGPVASADATPRPLAEADGHAVAGRVDVAHLPPGDYEVHARVLGAGASLATLSRAVRLARTLGAVRPAFALPRLPSSLPPMVPAFDRRSVLEPTTLAAMLGPVRERLAASAPATALEVVSRVEAGRHVTEADARDLAAIDPASAALLRGVGLVAEGRCEAGVPRLKSALGAAPTLWPAAFFLGACEAERGRDREAAGAWRTTLAQGGEGAPAVYEQAADALMRVDRAAEAASLLEEALEKWPATASLVGRAAVALAMSGRAPEALALLEAQTVRAPDGDLALIGVRLLVAAADDGEPLVSVDHDFAALVRFVRAYRAAGGPLASDFARWLEAVDR